MKRPQNQRAGDPADRSTMVVGGVRYNVASEERRQPASAERVVMSESRKSRLTIKENELFLCMDLVGDIPASGGGGLGLYFRDTRYLSRMETRLGGRPPVLLAWTAERGYAAGWEYTNLQMRGADGERVPQASIHVRRTRFIAGRLYDRLRFRNYGHTTVEVPVELGFAADFLDMFEVRGQRPRQRGTLLEPRLQGKTLTFAYVGRDGVSRTTVVEFDRKPEGFAEGTVRFTMRLAPRERAVLRYSVEVTGPDTAPEAEGEFNLKLGGVRRARDRWAAEGTEVFTDNEQFTALLRRGQQDLAMLLSDTPWGRVPMAGVPWFVAPFGRDLAIAGLQTLSLDQRLAVAAVRLLTRLQATEEDEERGAQPGKIMHELRRGELAAQRRIPHTPSYLSIDSTPLYLLLVCETVMWSGDLEFFELLREPILAALNWIDRHGDLDGDGFVEYPERVGGQAVHQGWRNSRDAIVHDDGTIAEGPIALAEVQAYVYHAKRRLARLFGQLGDVERSEQLQTEAEALKKRFNERFWLRDEQFLAMALDGRKRPVKTPSSTAGHCLNARIVADELVPTVVRRLLAPDMFSGWGVRTMSRNARAYNPVSFCNGSVWPADNSIIAYALKKLGYAEESNRIIGAVFDVARNYSDLRLPELFCGFTRQSMARPVSFPMACSPSATAAGSVFLMLQAMLGLYPAAEDNILYVHSPTLPRWLTDVSVANLRIGRSTVNLRFRRQGNQTVLAVRDKQGPVRIVIVD
jgi:glycogen debranching enzyme